MNRSENVPRWKRYLSPKFLVSKFREKGIAWCIHTIWQRFIMYIKFILINIKSKHDNIRYRERKQSDVLYAFYDLSVSPATFDILGFLVLAELERKKAGCNSLHVVIVPGPNEGFRMDNAPYNTENKKWRLRNILIPCCWMIPSCQKITICTSRKEAYAFQTLLVKHIFPQGYSVLLPKEKYLWSFIVAEKFQGVVIPSMQATPQALLFVREWIKEKGGKKKVITITLRESSWHLERNSKLKEWGAFARSLDPTIYCPVLIRDIEAAFKPLPAELDGLLIFPEVVWNIELRCALYELSYLNMFTSSGPAGLSLLNHRSRSITFNFIKPPFTAEHFRSHVGIEPGTQYMLEKPFHRLVWEDDRLEVIQKAFGEMCDKIERSSMEEGQK